MSITFLLAGLLTALPGPVAVVPLLPTGGPEPPIASRLAPSAYASVSDTRLPLFYLLQVHSKLTPALAPRSLCVRRFTCKSRQKESRRADSNR
jgi:hypothetical protein